jgi:hypothetical protein
VSSILSQIHEYWSGNQTLNAALPVTSVYLSIVPERLGLPYGVVLPVSSVPEYTFGSQYLETYVFQVSIYCFSAEQAEAIADTVMDQFEFLSVAGALACYRQNYMIQGEEVAGEHVYSALVTFKLLIERTIGE